MDANIKTAKDLSDGISREQVRLAMQQIPTMQGTSLFVALVLAYSVSDITSHAAVFEWLLMVLLIVIVRGFLYYAFRKVNGEQFNTKYWKGFY
jgi:UDP-N-acetylmuramyl pentapeptide phosphotransferase/UDP-N-acetylglucosamine-1-phosphate transferase